MELFESHLLSWILFIPTIAAVIVLFLPGNRVKLIRGFALWASLIPLVLAIYAWLHFDPSINGFLRDI